MRNLASSLLVLGMMTIAAMPPASATHGDTAYLIGIGQPFFAESAYQYGPGYLDQYWDFNVISTGGQDFCNDAHGGWDPLPDGSGTPGFSGTCDSGADFASTGGPAYIPYPNPNGLDVETKIQVTYDGATFDAILVVCDNGNARLSTVLGRTYCTDLLLFTSHP